VISDQRNKRQLVSEEDLLELNFDLDEMQELSTMSTHPHVRSLLLSLVNKLQNKMKKIKCDLTENLNTVKKMSDVVAGRSTCRKEEDPTSNQNLNSNITSHTTEELWIPVNRGHKKPPSVNHASYYQILIIINQYDLFSKMENYE
jgi:hypothetical protein